MPHHDIITCQKPTTAEKKHNQNEKYGHFFVLYHVLLNGERWKTRIVQ